MQADGASAAGRKSTASRYAPPALVSPLPGASLPPERMDGLGQLPLLRSVILPGAVVGGTFQPSCYPKWAPVIGTKDDSVLNWPLSCRELAQVVENLGVKHKAGQKNLSYPISAATLWTPGQLVSS